MGFRGNDAGRVCVSLVTHALTSKIQLLATAARTGMSSATWHASAARPGPARAGIQLDSQLVTMPAGRLPPQAAAACWPLQPGFQACRAAWRAAERVTAVIVAAAVATPPCSHAMFKQQAAAAVYLADLAAIHCCGAHPWAQSYCCMLSGHPWGRPRRCSVPHSPARARHLASLAVSAS